tara:strand:+ start:2505 stop:3947 length:1443 start_codon:yes stop_codon:yes gene_type:complete
MIDKKSSKPLYHQVADNLEGLIDGGTFRPGEKIPSVRQLSQDHRISISTVMEAYSLLEDRGRVQGRRRSGYFVLPQMPGNRRDRMPTAARHRNRPVELSCSAIQEAVMAAIEQPEIIPFGAATPGDDACPHHRLASISHAMARKHGPAAFRYTMVPGRKDLRTQIAKRNLIAGVEMKPSDIITTTGAIEAVGLALRAVAEPGDLIVVETPTYFGLLDLVQKLGLRTIETPLNPETGIDLDALAETLKSHRVAACLIQPDFQNPMGSLMPDDHKQKLVSMCAEAGVAIVADEIYSELHFGDKRSPSLKAFDEDGIVLQCSSFTKCLSPGLRVGWIAPGRYYDAVKKLKTSLSTASCTLSEMTAAEFLNSGGFDRQLRRVRALFFSQVQQIRQAIFDAFPEGTRVSAPQGGFILWSELPAGVDAEKLAVDALSENISVVPGSLCSATCQFRNAIRINCGHAWTSRMEQALGVLGHLASRQLR